MKKFLVLITITVFIAFGLVACGGGSSSNTASNTNNITDPTPTPTPNSYPDITGTYTLRDVNIVYSNGNALDPIGLGAAGTMTIMKDTISQSITIDNVVFDSSSKYSIDWNPNYTGGTIHILMGDGTKQDIHFMYSADSSGFNLQTISQGSNGSLNFVETDRWFKTDSTQSASVSRKESNNNIGDFIAIGKYLY